MTGPGFIVNALLVPYLLSAIRMAEAGVATVEDIDTAVVAGLSHPMGPLRLSDLIGLDTMKLIADSMYDEYKDAALRPAAAAACGWSRPANSARSPARASTRTELRRVRCTAARPGGSRIPFEPILRDAVHG